MSLSTRPRKQPIVNEGADGRVWVSIIVRVIKWDQDPKMSPRPPGTSQGHSGPKPPRAQGPRGSGSLGTPRVTFYVSINERSAG